jgi:hypothetical protein
MSIAYIRGGPGGPTRRWMRRTRPDQLPIVPPVGRPITQRRLYLCDPKRTLTRLLASRCPLTNHTRVSSRPQDQTSVLLKDELRESAFDVARSAIANKLRFSISCFAGAAEVNADETG